MFQPLINFGYKEDYINNGIIEITTDDAIYYYEIFSAREEEPDADFIEVNFNSDEEYIKFLNEMKERSIFQKDIAFDKNSKIITLVTCINDFKRDMRFVVQGVLINQ
jgi:sortase B